RVWTRDGAPERILAREDAGVRRVALSPDERLLAWATVNGAIKLLPLDGGSARALVGHTDLVHDLRFSADGRLLATPSNDHTARVWDVATGRSIVLQHPEARPYTAELSSDGELVATGADAVRVWDARTGRLLAIRRSSQPEESVVWLRPRMLGYAGDDRL